MPKETRFRYSTDVTIDEPSVRINLNSVFRSSEAISPQETSQLVHQALPNLERTDKLRLLLYLAEHGDASLLSGLALLPLANGQFATFQQRSSSVTYWCSADKLPLFPGLEGRFCDPNPTIHGTLLLVANSGKNPVKIY